MIIDGHSHACGKFLTPDGIIKSLDESGVDKVILVPGELNSKTEYSLPNIAKLFPNKNVVKITNYLTKLALSLTDKVNNIPAGNEYVYCLKQKTHGRVIQFVWITTEINNPSKYLNEKFAEWNFNGVKLHQCWETFSVDSNFFKEVALWAEKKDVPLFIHLYSDLEVTKIIEYKKSHPNLKLIVAHLFGLELFIKENFKNDNLYFDSSPPQLISKKRLLNAIHFAGVDKIIFGSDTPYGKENIKINLDRIKSLDISIKEKELIFGENIKRLLKL
jgi:uncharacterized protein